MPTHKFPVGQKVRFTPDPGRVEGVVARAVSSFACCPKPTVFRNTRSEAISTAYDDLADRIHAGDDTGARRVFHELQKTGRSRQEIVAKVSHLIERRGPDGAPGNSTGERRHGRLVST